MTVAQDKGNALERAVEAIEGLILRTSPAIREKAYKIESKKTISVGGVRHEIDVFVSFELGPGYNPVYIFECKNWKEAVGKNEIIVFAEKIAAAGAQRGFFVAKSFTADAKAQAAKESRMELIAATEHDPASTIVPFGFHTTFSKPSKISIVFRKWGARTHAVTNLDLSKATVTLNGTSLNLGEYAASWTNEAIGQSMSTFPSGTLPEGTYQRECTSQRKFAEGALLVDGKSIETVTMDVQFDVYLARPAVKTHFEINGRGRVITLEGHTAGDLTIETLEFTFAN